MPHAIGKPSMPEVAEARLHRVVPWSVAGDAAYLVKQLLATVCGRQVRWRSLKLLGATRNQEVNDVFRRNLSLFRRETRQYGRHRAAWMHVFRICNETLHKNRIDVICNPFEPGRLFSCSGR